MEKLKDIKVVTVIVLILVGITFFVGMMFQEYTDSKKYEDSYNQRDFNIGFKNNSENTITIRHKYVLNYKLPEKFGEKEVIDNDPNEPIIKLVNSRGQEVHKLYLSLSNDKHKIAETSNSTKLKPGERDNSRFEMIIGESTKDINNEIRFEVRVIVEVLMRNRWTQVYEVNLMERGPFFSLNKGSVVNTN